MPSGEDAPINGKRLLGAILDIAPPPRTLTDVGIGVGLTSAVFLAYGYNVTGISLTDAPKTVNEHERYNHIKQDLFDADIPQADIVWASHVIEHMPNVGLFLEKCRQLTKPDGWFCIVAPSDPTFLQVDGHLSFWTPAHLIYNMVIAGFDCSEAFYQTHNRDIGLAVRRKDRPHVDLNYDRGDLETLSPYFPAPIVHRQTNPWLKDKFFKELE